MLTDCKSVRIFAAGRTFLAALGNRIFAESLEQDITKKRLRHTWCRSRKSTFDLMKNNPYLFQVLKSSKYLVSLFLDFRHHAKKADSHDENIHILMLFNQFYFCFDDAKVALCAHTAKKNNSFFAYKRMFIDVSQKIGTKR